MEILIQTTESRNVVLIYVDELLDLSAYDTFGEAAKIAVSDPMTKAIVVDLGRTRQLRKSGITMLRSLHQRAGRLKERLYLSNVGPEIKRKLAQGGFPRLFHINHHNMV